MSRVMLKVAPDVLRQVIGLPNSAVILKVNVIRDRDNGGVPVVSVLYEDPALGDKMQEGSLVIEEKHGKKGIKITLKDREGRKNPRRKVTP